MHQSFEPSHEKTNNLGFQPVQSDEQARSLKFWISEEGLYYIYSKTKKLISCAVTAQLTCAFVFANAYCWLMQQLKSNLHAQKNTRMLIYTGV